MDGRHLERCPDHEQRCRAPAVLGGRHRVRSRQLDRLVSELESRYCSPVQNYLIALDLTKSGTRYPHMVKWSAAADPGTVPASWDETDRRLTPENWIWPKNLA